MHPGTQHILDQRKGKLSLKGDGALRTHPSSHASSLWWVPLDLVKTPSTQGRSASNEVFTRFPSSQLLLMVRRWKWLSLGGEEEPLSRAAVSWGSNQRASCLLVHAIGSVCEDAIIHQKRHLQRPHGEQVPSSVQEGGDRKAKMIFCFGGADSTPGGHGSPIQSCPPPQTCKEHPPFPQGK